MQLAAVSIYLVLQPLHIVHLKYSFVFAIKRLSQALCLAIQVWHKQECTIQNSSFVCLCFSRQFNKNPIAFTDL